MIHSGSESGYFNNRHFISRSMKTRVPSSQEFHRMSTDSSEANWLSWSCHQRASPDFGGSSTESLREKFWCAWPGLCSLTIYGTNVIVVHYFTNFIINGRDRPNVQISGCHERRKSNMTTSQSREILGLWSLLVTSIFVVYFVPLF